MKEFMTILTDVKVRKVSMAELIGKIDQLTDMKESLQEKKKPADNADYRSIENGKDIKEAVLLLLTAGGVVTDPTVAGISDSKQALKYDKPKKDSDYIG